MRKEVGVVGVALDSNLLALVQIPLPEREFFIDNLLVRIHFIIVMIRWTGLAPWEFEFPFPGSLTSIPLPNDHASASVTRATKNLAHHLSVSSRQFSGQYGSAACTLCLHRTGERSWHADKGRVRVE